MEKEVDTGVPGRPGDKGTFKEGLKEKLRARPVWPGHEHSGKGRQVSHPGQPLLLTPWKDTSTCHCSLRHLNRLQTTSFPRGVSSRRP